MCFCCHFKSLEPIQIGMCDLPKFFEKFTTFQYFSGLLYVKQSENSEINFIFKANQILFEFETLGAVNFHFVFCAAAYVQIHYTVTKRICIQYIPNLLKIHAFFATEDKAAS